MQWRKMALAAALFTPLEWEKKILSLPQNDLGADD